MKIAIVGFGFVGAALLHEVTRVRPDVEVDVFESPHTASASVAASGLLHPFVGKKSLLSERGWEGYEAAVSLIRSLEAPVALFTGVWRVGEPLDDERFKPLPSDLGFGVHAPYGFLIEEGVTLFPDLYLMAIRQKCTSSHVRFIEAPFDENPNYDLILYALGAGVKEYAWSEELAIKYNKGEALFVKLPKGVSGAKTAVIGNGYIAPTRLDGVYSLGSTYQHHDIFSSPHLENCIERLGKRTSSFLPPIEQFDILSIKGGVRVAPKVGHYPICHQVDARRICLTAFGSRGLLYHALVAKELVSDLF